MQDVETISKYLNLERYHQRQANRWSRKRLKRSNVSTSIGKIDCICSKAKLVKARDRQIFEAPKARSM